MLKRIRLKDFKSFVDEEVQLAPLTLLVGANASGKSNLLDAIRFLQGYASGLTLGEVLNGEKRTGPHSWPGIRGRAEEAARLGQDGFSIETDWTTAGDLKEPLRMSIACLTFPSIGKQTSDEDREPWRPLADVMASVKTFSIRPAVMRDYGSQGDPLGEDGHNLSGVLADLCQNPDDKQALVHWLAELCAPEIEDLDFIEVKELGDVMAMFVEKGGKRISARSISDGTLHFLGTLLALRTAEPGSVILIEEIETGLHPTRIRLLVEYLETVTRERDIQVIATTHSPVVLQWLSDQSLRDTVVFGRIPEHEGTIMRRLGDLPHFEEVIQKKGIEELFSTGWLEMAL